MTVSIHRDKYLNFPHDVIIGRKGEEAKGKEEKKREGDIAHAPDELQLWSKSG